MDVHTRPNPYAAHVPRHTHAHTRTHAPSLWRSSPFFVLLVHKFYPAHLRLWQTHVSEGSLRPREVGDLPKVARPEWPQASQTGFCPALYLQCSP